MKRGIVSGVFLTVLLILLVSWAAPALALYAPWQEVTAWRDNNVIYYQVTDPRDGSTKQESWTLDLGFYGVWTIGDPSYQGGLVTWISTKTITGEANSSITVHYRIYDPGRGKWIEGQHDYPSDYHRVISDHTVNDGVVSWLTHIWHPGIYEVAEREFCYVTYEPDQGVWVFDHEVWGLRAFPQNIQVKDGVVTYILNSPYYILDVLFSIFDPEVRQWVKGRFTIDDSKLQTNLNIQNATVHVSSASYSGGQVGYDSYNHVWNPGWDTSARPSFSTSPASGFAPLWVCFWDTSIALNGGSWSWDFGDYGVSIDRSPVHRFNQAGTYSVQQTVATGSGVFQAGQTVQVFAVNPPSGGIEINNGAAYTTSFNVTLGLHASPDTTEMCFYQVPGFIWWGDWQPFAASLPWELSSLHILGQSPDGVHTVHVKFRNDAKRESPEYLTSIIVDTTAPAGSVIINGGKPTTSNPKVNLAINASDANGVTKMSLGVLQAPWSFFIWGPWEDYQTSKTLQFNSWPGKKKVFVRFQDLPGNISQGYEAEIVLTKLTTCLPLLLGD